MRISSYKNRTEQRQRIMAMNAHVYNSRAVEQISASNGGCFPNRLLPLCGQPMSMADFGAYMANTRTHKRNNKRR